jgi:3-methyladenine DNA glycosylase/8-oxoguanine DNA glycosylase
MFCLQAPDLLPLGDVAVVNTIKLLDIHEKEAMEIYTKMESTSLDGYFFIVALLPQKKK